MKSSSRERPKTAAGFLTGTVKHSGRETSASNATLNSSQSKCTNVQGPTTVTLADRILVNGEENAKISPRRSHDNTRDVDKLEDGLKKVTAEADNGVVEVKFVIPEREQTAEEFDVRHFHVDVEQLAASLQAVVHRQVAEDFEGDRLVEMLSAVVGTMQNFQTFVSRVYNLLESIRDEMKSATDLMHQKIIQPTEWDYLTFKGQYDINTNIIITVTVIRGVQSMLSMTQDASWAK